MRQYQIIVLIIFAATVLNGCRDNPVGVRDVGPLFYATVVDANNRPIADVGMHYVFYGVGATESRNLMIRFSLQSTDTITVTIFDPFGKEISRLYHNKPSQPGSYIYFYDAGTLTNGIYTFSIVGATINQQIRMFVLTEEFLKLTTTRPLTKTDAVGKIRIAYSILGIGEQFAYYNGSNYVPYVISDSITVVLVKEGYKDYVQTIKLDTINGFEVRFVLEKN
jgi:hypothetical protein